MQQDRRAFLGDATPLSDADFMAMRLWAMNFARIRAVGVASWPVFRYTRPQVERLRAIAAVIPQKTLLIWTSCVGVVWFFFAFAIGFLPLTPLIAMTLPPRHAFAASLILLAAIFANLLSAFVGGSVIATWIGGRLTKALQTLPSVTQEPGDAELFASMRRQMARVAIFGVLSAAAPFVFAALLR